MRVAEGVQVWLEYKASRVCPEDMFCRSHYSMRWREMWGRKEIAAVTAADISKLEASRLADGWKPGTLLMT